MRDQSQQNMPKQPQEHTNTRDLRKRGSSTCPGDHNVQTLLYKTNGNDMELKNMNSVNEHQDILGDGQHSEDEGAFNVVSQSRNAEKTHSNRNLLSDASTVSGRNARVTVHYPKIAMAPAQADGASLSLANVQHDDREELPSYSQVRDTSARGVQNTKASGVIPSNDQRSEGLSDSSTMPVHKDHLSQGLSSRLAQNAATTSLSNVLPRSQHYSQEGSLSYPQVKSGSAGGGGPNTENSGNPFGEAQQDLLPSLANGDHDNYNEQLNPFDDTEEVNSGSAGGGGQNTENSGNDDYDEEKNPFGNTKDESPPANGLGTTREPNNPFDDDTETIQNRSNVVLPPIYSFDHDEGSKTTENPYNEGSALYREPSKKKKKKTKFPKLPTMLRGISARTKPKII